MTAFADFLDALAHEVATHPSHPRAGYPAGVRALADALKHAAAEGEIHVQVGTPLLWPPRGAQ